MRKILVYAACLVLSGVLPAQAVTVNWIDWETSSVSPDGTFTATGTITSGSETIGVTYTNTQGVGFFQNGESGNTIDYFSAQGSNSPYESGGPDGVDNRPPGAEMIALDTAGLQTLEFSQTVENLYYSFVSMNGNGYSFSQEFEILSYTRADVDGNGTDSDGYWGGGLVEKVDNLDGTFSLNAIAGNGTEPHGTILFTDTFDTLTWVSLTSEFWNGFTIGVEGTDAQVPDDPTNAVPLPAAAWLLLGALGGLGLVRRRA
ncbi:VPLPA-CTERM sorting domain-containing protein [Ovoidimarina sediminis]|uniref:VPLPA-CTERM sorting domain-containing protein n=1 Tax=Ovoidimarina sediminis TaxID=3079856 RepID=UPI002912CF58|nr:VPLPA-CTERM sorting domain-containing protein [Rhodophyticola sp. MJ-SS7]MDU8941795.1 VPLPA-CTERM sorting domain-containing protein [Rhodophyticola sp. MJ-SS7]